MALFCEEALAQGVPAQLPFVGNLSSGGTAASGSHHFVFTLYDSTPSQVWTESQNLTVTNGMVYASLGAVTALTPSILSGASLTLGVSVDGTELTPRTDIGSVPYAVRAGVASSADALGALLPGDVQRRVSGTCAAGNAVQAISAAGTVDCTPFGTGTITAVGTANSSGLSGGGTSGALSLSLATCPAGQYLRSGGASWACGTDPTYTATSPLKLTGTSFSLAPCASGEVLKTNSGATGWACGADNNSVYTDAMAVAAVTATTTTHFATFSSMDFVYAKGDGTILPSCQLPSSNCPIPTGTTNLYIPTHVPAPASITQASCLVLDNDATTDISMWLFNSSGAVNAVPFTTSGANSGSRALVGTFSPGVNVTNSSRGNVLRLQFVSTSGQPTMFLFECTVTYTTTGL